MRKIEKDINKIGNYTEKIEDIKKYEDIDTKIKDIKKKIGDIEKRMGEASNSEIKDIKGKIENIEEATSNIRKIQRNCRLWKNCKNENIIFSEPKSDDNINDGKIK